MPQLDPSSFASQLIWLAITFVILYVLMARIALPRISEVLEARRDRIARDLDDVASLKDEAEAALAAFEASMAEARSKAEALLAQAAEEQAGEAAARLAEFDARLAGRQADAEARIDEALRAAMANIGDIAGDVVHSATAKLIGVEPDDAAVASALDAAAKGDA